MNTAEFMRALTDAELREGMQELATLPSEGGVVFRVRQQIYSELGFLSRISDVDNAIVDEIVRRWLAGQGCTKS